MSQFVTKKNPRFLGEMIWDRGAAILESSVRVCVSPCDNVSLLAGLPLEAQTTLKTRSREYCGLMKKMSVFGMSLVIKHLSFPQASERQAHFADTASIGCRWRHFGPILSHYWPISLSCSRHKGCWGRNIWLVGAIQDMAPKARLGIQALEGSWNIHSTGVPEQLLKFEP